MGSEMCIRDSNTGKPICVQLDNVYYCPDQPFNLISVDTMIDNFNWSDPSFKNDTWSVGKYTFGMSKNHGARIMQSISMDTVPRKKIAADGRTEILVPAVTRSQRATDTTSPDVIPSEDYRSKGKHIPSSEDPTKVNFPTYPDHNKPGYSLREANGSSNAKRPPNAPKEDKGDWMLKKSVYNGLASQFGNGTGHFDCDLFSDGRGTENGNQQETVAYSPDNSAFNHLWTGKSYWANPPFIARVIQDYLIKANEDFLINPEQTSHCCVLPYIPTAPWWHLTQYWKVVKVYEKDEFLFHKARTQTYSLNDKKLTPVTSEDGPTNRVFIDPVGYPICVLYRDVHTPVRPDPYVKAHLRFGHCDSQLLNKLVEQGVDLGVNLNQSTLTRIKPLCHCVSCKLSKMT